MLPSGIYSSVIEADYVKNMCTYFSERTKALRRQDITTYAEVCLSDIQKELERSEKYLVSNDVAKAWLIREIVDKNIDFFQAVDSASWMQRCSEAASDPRVKCVYELLLMSHQGRALLETAFRTFFAQSLQNVVRRAPNTEGMYIDIIQLFHHTFQSLKVAAPVSRESSVGVEKAIETGLRWGFVDGTASSVNYCILAMHIADRLSHTMSHAADVNETVKSAVEEAVHLYSFLPEVDPSAREAFLGAHRAHLARRLLHGCYNEDLERRTLDLLGVIHLSPTLFRSRAMIQSASSQAIYISSPTKRSAVLSKSAWPLTDSCAQVVLPPALDAAIAEAREVCQEANKGQIVEFSRWYSFGVVRLRLAEGCGQPHVDLEVSLPQLVLLQCFNRPTPWPFMTLCEEIQITPVECRVILAPLVTSGVLLCQPWPPQRRSVLERHLGFNPTAATLHLVPQTIPRALGEQEAPSMPAVETVRMSRIALEAGTMQLLKRDGAQTVAAITNHLNSMPHNVERAPVSEKMVKRSLELLIQRGFIQRNEERLFEFRFS
ncbi:cullin 1 [Strigomonas culicis]|uniref:Cullin 1 n=1 Tax=Strigomonas culicis TaxID=28005 RepID=S9WBN9_9TRYP|nr:cullin 1 [Strigomonas culicis]|eukprot:EPY36526.1 cullin 1 [Strigomonas culicis]